MKIAVTGGTGFLGPSVVEEMLRAGHQVVVLVHRTRPRVGNHPGLSLVQGDVRDAASLREAFAGCDAVAHLVALIREDAKRGQTFEKVHVEGTRAVVDAAKAAGVRRFLLMSANGVGEGIDTPYFHTKAQMEQMVKDAGFDWTIFRPSFIAAADEGGFDAQFSDIVEKFPALPSFDGGRFAIQPVSRRNVAESFARALGKPESVGKTYQLVGPERMTWNEYLRRLMTMRRRKRVVAWVPAWGAILAARALGPIFPADPDQIKMLVHGNVGDPGPAVKDLGLDLERWEDAVSGLRR